MTAEKKIEVGVSFCLLFDTDEYSLLVEILKESGYPETKEGLKNFILDGGVGEQEPESKISGLGDAIKNAIKDNPELTEQLAKDGIDLARKFFKKK